MRPAITTCCLVLLFCACKKAEDIPSSTTITYSNLVDTIVTPSCLFAGEMATFKFSLNKSIPANAITSSVWDFGDGSSSYTSTPSHTYHAAGMYTLSVTVNGEITTKSIQIGNALRSPHTAAMGNKRNWTGVASTYAVEFDKLYNSNSPLIDTFLTLNIIDDRCVDFRLNGTRPLFLLSEDTIAKKLVFTENCTSIQPMLTYYYETDSMVYVHIWSHEKQHGSLSMHTYR